MQAVFPNIGPLWPGTVVIVFLMLAVGIPLILRLKRGRIPANPGEGLPEDILRSRSPANFYLHTAIMFVVELLLVGMLVMIWTVGM